MSHSLLRILSEGALLLLVIFLPVATYLYTDRFRQAPSPGQYATLFGVAVVAGAFLFVPALSIVFATALLAMSIAWFTAHVALTGVRYERTIDPPRLFPGDGAELVVRLSNKKLLPLAWVAVEDPIRFSVVRSTTNLDDLLEFSGGIEVQENLGHALINRAAIGPFQTLVRTYRLVAHQRGVYTLGPATLRTGDPFGVYPKEAEMGGRVTVTVYPRIYGPGEIDFPFREALGDLVARRALADDPTLIAGSREYRPGDPLRHMHWKATARTGEMQVRLTDPSTTAQIMLVLNLNTFQHVWQGVDLERMESAIEVAASIAVWTLEHDFPVGLRSNGVIPGTDLSPRLAPSASPQQTTAVLHSLARLAFSGQISAEALLLDEADRLSAGGSILFVTPVITPQLAGILTSRKLKGRASVVYCGRHAAPVVRGVPITLVTPPGEVHRAVS